MKTRCDAPQKGFTALELVLVLAATLILGALAVSLYRTHQVRTQIAMSVADAAPVQTLVTAVFMREGAPPHDAAAAGIDRTAHAIVVGPYVEAVEIADGRIDLRFGQLADSAIAGRVLSLTPFETAEREILWVCGNELPGVGLKPLGFISGATQPDRTGTAIEDRYLPSECR